MILLKLENKSEELFLDRSDDHFDGCSLLIHCIQIIRSMKTIPIRSIEAQLKLANISTRRFHESPIPLQSLFCVLISFDLLQDWLLGLV